MTTRNVARQTATRQWPEACYLVESPVRYAQSDEFKPEYDLSPVFDDTGAESGLKER